MESKIIAVDFDGTLFTEPDAYPQVGKPIKENIQYLRKLQRSGHRLVLSTCRAGIALRNAVKACLEQGLIFTAINNQDPMAAVLWPSESSSKVYADVYFDTKSVTSVEKLKRIIKEK